MDHQSRFLSPQQGGYKDRSRSRRTSTYRNSDPYKARTTRRALRGGRYTVYVWDLPTGASWQDLKDFCRNHHVRSPKKADVHPRGEGTLEYDDPEDVAHAVAQLHRQTIAPGFGARQSYPSTEVSVSDKRPQPRSHCRDESLSRERTRRRGGSRTKYASSRGRCERRRDLSIRTGRYNYERGDHRGYRDDRDRYDRDRRGGHKEEGHERGCGPREPHSGYNNQWSRHRSNASPLRSPSSSRSHSEERRLSNKFPNDGVDSEGGRDRGSI